MSPKPILTVAALAALTLATGCAQRQKSMGEAMIDAPRPGQAVAQAPAPDPAPATPAIPAAPVVPVDPAPAPTVVATQPQPAGTIASVGSVEVAALAPGADEAARLRNWKPVTSLYQNGNVLAGPIYRILPPPPASNRPVDVAMVDYYGTALAVPQFFGTPVWMFFTPPWTEITYQGEAFAPSYTLDDPIDQSRDKTLGIIKLPRN